MLEKRYIQDYQMIKRITKGSQGSIWEVSKCDIIKSITDKQEKSESLVLKRIRHKGDDSKKLFLREKNYRTVLKHEYLVEIEDMIEGDEISYIFYKQYPTDLLQYLKKSPNNRIPEKTVRRWMRQLTLAMIYLNTKKLMHRDLKPDNILLTEDSENGNIKICDFGLIREIPEDQTIRKSTNDSLDDTLTHVGTLEYAAPEIRKLKKYSYNCDVWSLGVITHVLIYGKYPKIKKNILNFPEINDDPNFHVSQKAKVFIKNCLTVDRKNRKEFIEVIEEPFLKEETEAEGITGMTENEGAQVGEDKNVLIKNNENGKIEIILDRISTDYAESDCKKKPKIERGDSSDTNSGINENCGEMHDSTEKGSEPFEIESQDTIRVPNN